MRATGCCRSGSMAPQRQNPRSQQRLTVRPTKMSSKALNAKNHGESVSATSSGPHPAAYPLGSPQSRAAARAMLARRKPVLTGYDKDTLTIYHGVRCLLSPRIGWQAQPDWFSLSGNPIYEHGQALSFKLHPIIPSHLDERGKRWTLASSEFELGFGREPEPGDILRYEH